MKHLLALFSLFLFLALTGCNKVETPEPAFEKLFGKWEWVERSGGFTGEFQTPETEGYTMEVSYNRNGKYTSYKRKVKTSSRSFAFEKRSSIFSSQDEYQITYTKKFSKKGFIPHSFSFIGNDTLILRDECHDCYSYTYVRK